MFGVVTENLYGPAHGIAFIFWLEYSRAMYLGYVSVHHFEKYLALPGGFGIWHNILLVVIVLERFEVSRYHLNLLTRQR